MLLLDRTSETKVRYQELPSVGNQQIGRLEIPMQDLVLHSDEDQAEEEHDQVPWDSSQNFQREFNGSAGRKK